MHGLPEALYYCQEKGKLVNGSVAASSTGTEHFLFISTIVGIVEEFFAVPVQPRSSPCWRRAIRTLSGSAIVALCHYQQISPEYPCVEIHVNQKYRLLCSSEHARVVCTVCVCVRVYIFGFLCQFVLIHQSSFFRKRKVHYNCIPHTDIGVYSVACQSLL